MDISEIKDNNERLRKYRKHGFTKEAIQDKYWKIRLKAYEKYGYTKEALKDDHWLIRQKAKEYFENKGE